MQKNLVVALIVWVAGAFVGVKAEPESTTLDQKAVSKSDSTATSAASDNNPPYSAGTLYALLVAEIAGQRQLYDIALGNYLLEAHRTQDPGVAARATQIAQYIGAEQASLDASTLWVKVDSQNPKAHIAMSTELIKAQRFSEAAIHLQSALSLDDTSSVEFVSFQAHQLSPEAKEQWINQINSIVKVWPEHSALLFNLASLHRQQNDTKQALELLDKVIELDPEFYSAWNLKTRLQASSENVDDALTTIEKALKQFKGDKAFTVLKARLLVKAKNIEGARDTFKLLAQKHPQDNHILLPLALTQLELQEYEEAETSLRKLLVLDKMTNEANYYLGRIEQRNQNYDSALEHFLAMTSGREYLAAQSHIIEIYADLGELDKAINHVQTQRELDTNHQQAYFLMEVELLNRSQRYDESIGVLNNALKAYADNTDLRYSRAMVSEKLGNISQLEADLSYIIDREPENATALNALGYTLADQTPRLDEALDLIKKARNLSPEDPAIIDSLGWVYYRMGRLHEALALLQEAFKLFPDPEVAAHLGEVLWQLGRDGEAHVIWKKGLTTEPSSAIIKDTMDRLTNEP